MPINGVPAATSPAAEAGQQASIPAGYVGFCLRYSDQCELPRNTTTVLTLSEDNWALLNRVNHDTNRAITYEDDEPHYGIPDYWTIASDGYGDCEDFRHSTKREGLPAGCRIASRHATPSPSC